MEVSSNTSEKELAALCAKSDRSACRELYTRYAARVYMLCFRYSNDREEAEDLTHDTMIEVFGSIKRFSYKGEGSLYAWIRKIAFYVTVDWIRKRRVLDVSPLREDEPVIDESGTDDQTADIPVPALMEMISTLPETQRLILNLYCIDGVSHKEIAEMLGIKMKTSSSLLSKAKKALSEKIKEYLNKNK